MSELELLERKQENKDVWEGMGGEEELREFFAFFWPKYRVNQEDSWFNQTEFHKGCHCTGLSLSHKNPHLIDNHIKVRISSCS